LGVPGPVIYNGTKSGGPSEQREWGRKKGPQVQNTGEARTRRKNQQAGNRGAIERGRREKGPN